MNVKGGKKGRSRAQGRITVLQVLIYVTLILSHLILKQQFRINIIIPIFTVKETGILYILCIKPHI